MARNNNNNYNEEPNTAPDPDRWYNITLGPSFKDHHNHHPSPKFCTLRYEFKPASIDKNQPGTLHKGKNNKVKVEYHNNQYGKPKVTFDGVSEDYKENDAVLFFDGENFRLERLHRAVKRLRHVRLPGESAAAAAATAAPATFVAPAVETYLSSPISKLTNQQSFNKDVTHQILAQVEQAGIGDSESSGAELKEVKILEILSSPPNPSAIIPDVKDSESEGDLDIVNDHDDDLNKRANVSVKGSRTGLDIDINLPHQADTDDEIADVDISDDEVDKGPNAAEALRAQVNAEGRKEHASSSSTSSGSDSSGSSSGSGSGSESGSGSRSDSESSDSDSISI
ncbi:suppressor protein SRP40 [Ricinus communis]|uniref:Transcription elongation factor Eaf N-terminal domain-containing protein n=1 Tax=Ricinus communis TaxID=3988 RepID=B9T321_RICCO|nr:suppressor protein SRP40 [Ricinus communis]EEF29743.1 conserved hypothetical protein [Ricinus communis]|eukprot:XP_002532640.1 suppressor protein SRP40 [Ricinus communis]